uniref:ABC transporter related n=1 Tax=Leptospirillum ferrodiazotrophum TaxID=412449 RepID=C6HYQ9_9BACT|nr:MAG: ABC transporter related [Leptospirillum ferrodiazotrophum]
MKSLVAEEIVKVYQEGGSRVEALRGISLALAPSEIVILEGPSGSGKTTFMSVAGCLLSPTSGRLSVEGQGVDFSRPKDMVRVRRESIGFVFQSFNLFPALTVLENVLYALQIRGKLTPEYEREARTILEQIGLGHRLDFIPARLSGGEKQRVAIARALSGGSRILFADEPTANLDSHVGLEVLGILRRLAKEEGRSVLVATHDPAVRTIADRVVRMRDGCLVEGENG